MTYSHDGSTASLGVPLLDHCLRYSGRGASRGSRPECLARISVVWVGKGKGALVLQRSIDRGCDVDAERPRH